MSEVVLNIGFWLLAVVAAWWAGRERGFRKGYEAGVLVGSRSVHIPKSGAGKEEG